MSVLRFWSREQRGARRPRRSTRGDVAPAKGSLETVTDAPSLARPDPPIPDTEQGLALAGKDARPSDPNASLWGERKPHRTQKAQVTSHELWTNGGNDHGASGSSETDPAPLSVDRVDIVAGGLSQRVNATPPRSNSRRTRRSGPQLVAEPDPDLGLLIIDSVGPSPDAEGWVDLREASRQAGVSIPTLRKWYRQEKISSRLAPGPHGPQREVLRAEVLARVHSMDGRDPEPNPDTRDGVQAVVVHVPEPNPDSGRGLLTLSVEQVWAMYERVHREARDAEQRAARAEAQAGVLKEQLDREREERLRLLSDVLTDLQSEIL
jgi:hypothetical protein